MKRNFFSVFLIVLFVLVFGCSSIAIEENVSNQEEDFSAVENESASIQSSKLMVETSNKEELENIDNAYEVVEIADNLYIVDYKNEKVAKEEYEKLLKDENVENVCEDVKVSILDNMEALKVNPEHIAWGIDCLGIDCYLDYLSYKNSPEILVGVFDTGINDKHETVENRVKLDMAYNFINATDIYRK